MPSIYVGAVDCSFNYCGCALLCRPERSKKAYLKATGIVENPRPEKKGSLIDLDRCSLLYSGLKSFLDYTMLQSGHKVIAFEVPGGSQSSRAAACLGMARGVLGSALSQFAFEDITDGSWMRAPIMPSEVHKRVTGKIKAEKEDIIQYVLDNYKGSIYFQNKKYWVHQVLSNGITRLEGYTKGQFEHIADAIVMAEIGLERTKE